MRRLYERHGPALPAYACSLVVDAGIAEDVVQQVFVSLLQGGIAMPEAPAAYLYRAVRNAALNTRRNGQRNVPVNADAACFVHCGGNPEAALALQAALTQLPEEQREIVIMRLWSGMTLQEIAEASGASLNTVASRYRYAVERLRERLKPYQSARGM